MIEDSIFTIYQKALQEGNMDQAAHAVDLMKHLKEKVDLHGFIDHATTQQPPPLFGSFFEPFPYRYAEETGMVVIHQTATMLTTSEKKLFELLMQHETNGIDVKVITRSMIRQHIWEDNSVSYNAVRLAILRLRTKIERYPENPEVLINYYKNGYVFLGKRVQE